MQLLKLVITKNKNNTWNEFVIDLFRDEVIFEYSGIQLLSDTKEYFDEIEKEIKIFYPNIVEVERFI